MKRRSLNGLLSECGVLTLLWVLCVHALQANAYSVDWFTVDGGGGRSSGGTYLLTGTIGQPDTAFSVAGKYGLEGGFWTAMAVPQSEDVPHLIFQIVNGVLWISWSPDTPGFRLEQCQDLSASEWINAPPGNPVAFPLSGGTCYFRICKP